jgi:hypothetical protein
VSLACRKAKDLGYPHELWTTRLLARHARDHGPAAGHVCLARVKNGSWLNLVEGFFSKMARSVLRCIRVASKAELKQRILAYLNDLHREPVVHTWTYKMKPAA